MQQLDPRIIAAITTKGAGHASAPSSLLSNTPPGPQPPSGAHPASNLEQTATSAQGVCSVTVCLLSTNSASILVALALLPPGSLTPPAPPSCLLPAVSAPPSPHKVEGPRRQKWCSLRIQHGTNPTRRDTRTRTSNSPQHRALQHRHMPKTQLPAAAAVGKEEEEVVVAVAEEEEEEEEDGGRDLCRQGSSRRTTTAGQWILS